MAISDRITSIEEHIKESYQELEGIGIDTTGVNNNLENIPKLIDGYWETLPKVTGEGTSITLDNTKEGKMKINLKGNTYQEETPTPETPQDIHVVSGDNSIVVCGKNLFHFESQRNTGWYSDVPNMIKEIGAYTLSINDTSLSGVWAVWFADNNGDRIGNFIKPSSSVSTPSTFNVTQEQANAPYIRILPNASGLHDIQNYKIQIEKGSTATTYEPYKSQSYPINLGVKNLWKNQITGWLPQSGSYPTTNSSYPNARYILINLLKDQSITLSGITFDGSGRVRYIDKDTNQVVGNMTYLDSAYYTATHTFGDGFYEGTITAKKDFIVGIMDLNGNVNNLIVNYGTTPQYISETPIELCKIGDYQDYIYKEGKKWYKYGAIGKYEFTGNETLEEYSGAGAKKITNMIVAHTFESNATPLGYSNISAMKLRTGIYTLSAEGLSYSNNEIYLYFANKTSQEILNILKNTDIYYLLATPTYTEITDSTLLSQLNALAKSYNSQTNISQENNDLASLLNATALSE